MIQAFVVFHSSFLLFALYRKQGQFIMGCFMGHTILVKQGIQLVKQGIQTMILLTCQYFGDIDEILI